mgnify:FL=1
MLELLLGLGLAIIVYFFLVLVGLVGGGIVGVLLGRLAAKLFYPFSKQFKYEKDFFAMTRLNKLDTRNKREWGIKTDASGFVTDGRFAIRHEENKKLNFRSYTRGFWESN